jgi:hypothetical protein
MVAAAKGARWELGLIADGTSWGVGVAAVKGGRGVALFYRAGGQEGRQCDKGGLVAGVVGCH